MSRGRLVYVVGASGAGKDSLIARVVAEHGAELGLVVARRTITRPAEAGDEGHEAVDHAAFAAIDRQGAFALTWRAGDTRYGIRRDLDHDLAAGRHVAVSGSRAALAPVRQAYPDLLVVLVTASEAARHRRLLQRGREDLAAIDERLRRAEAYEPEPEAGWVVIANDGSLEVAARHLAVLLAAALRPCGSPTP